MSKLTGLALLLPFFLVSAGTANAQGTDCRTIDNSTARLACYDKASPPLAKGRSDRSATKETKAVADDRPRDFLAVENAKLDAALKNVCRGC